MPSTDQPGNTHSIPMPDELENGPWPSFVSGIPRFSEAGEEFPGIGVDVDPNMISHPRESSYVRMDGWDEEAAKWFARKREAKRAG